MRFLRNKEENVSKKSGSFWHIPFVLQSLRGQCSPYLS